MVSEQDKQGGGGEMGWAGRVGSLLLLVWLAGWGGACALLLVAGV